MNAIVPPRIESLFNVVTRRIRAAQTIFGDRVKLDLRQRSEDQWSALATPYLLVNPLTTRPSRDVDADSMVNPRLIQFIAQFDGRGSEAEHLAAIDIETAEKQLIYVLANWQPQSLRFGYRPTTYSGMRIEGTREPKVKVVYLFTFNEQIVLPDPLSFGEEDIPDESVVIDGVAIHVSDPCCNVQCEPVAPPDFSVAVTGGECPSTPVEPCEPGCPPMLGDSATNGGQP